MGSFLLDILDFVVMALFLWAMARKLRSLFNFTRINVRAPGGGPPQHAAGHSHRGATARDPVCGIFVSTELSHQLKRGSQTLHFCSRECLKQYEKDTPNVIS